MKTFLIAILVIYAVYYTCIIIYDVFIKKTKSGDDTEMEFVFETNEKPKEVSVSDIGLSSDHSDDVDAEDQREINIINGKIEDQGMESSEFIVNLKKQLSNESREMFAGVNF